MGANWNELGSWAFFSYRITLIAYRGLVLIKADVNTRVVLTPGTEEARAKDPQHA